MRRTIFHYFTFLHCHFHPSNVCPFSRFSSSFYNQCDTTSILLSIKPLFHIMAFTSVVMYTTNYICLKGKFQLLEIFSCHFFSPKKVSHIEHYPLLYRTFYLQEERSSTLVKKRRLLWRNITRTTESRLIIKQYLSLYC
jgi:hypothetical protein